MFTGQSMTIGGNCLFVVLFCSALADRHQLVHYKQSTETYQHFRQLLTVSENISLDSKVGTRIVETLINIFQTQYYGLVEIGSPSKVFRLVFDTGSPYMWVRDSRVGLSYQSFSCQQSSTCVNTSNQIETVYGQGEVDGWILIDDVKIGNITVKNQTFIGATEVKQSQLKEEGILGLGIPISGLAISPVFTTIIGQNLTSEPIFSIVLEIPGDSNNNGVIVFGQSVNDLYQGNLTYSQVIEGADQWLISVGVKFDGETICESCDALIDTGTSFIVAPDEHFDTIKGRLNITYTKNYGKCQIFDCSEAEKDLPDFTFIINGTEFIVTKLHYILNLNPDAKNRNSDSFRANDLCVLGISNYVDNLNQMSQSIWILGDVFMRKFYFEFNYQQKSIAIANLLH